MSSYSSVVVALRGNSPVPDRLAAQQCGDDQQVVRQHGGPDKQFEMLATLDERPLHAAAPKEHGDTAFNAGRNVGPA